MTAPHTDSAMTERYNGPRFWIVDDVNDRDGNSPTDWMESGVLVGVVDENEGGIVAYCHKDTADRILTALRQAARN